MNDSSTTEPAPDTIETPFDLMTNRDVLSRWLTQAFESGWDVARYFPNDKIKPELVLTWEKTAADGGLSPLLTYIRKQ